MYASFQDIVDPPLKSITDIHCVYVGQILTIVVLCLAKLISILILAGLTPTKRMLLAFSIVAVFVMLWGFFAMSALCFRCRVPQPWFIPRGRCIDRVILFAYALIYD